MRSLQLFTLIFTVGIIGASLFGIQQAATTRPNVVKTVNAMCPIGKEPIVSSAGTVEYKGHTVGLCCPSCGKNFLAWDEKRKDEFITLAIAGKEPGHSGQGEITEAVEVDSAKEAWSEPYALAKCPVSGQGLGSMGEPVVKVYGGREVRFCCAGCIGRFEADQTGYFKTIDEAIVKDQLRYYPTDRCVVSGEPLHEGGEDIATNVVVGNRLVRTCCSMCAKKVKAGPKPFIAKLDEQAAAAQRKTYPLETCVVAGGALGSMGEPTERVVAGRLMRFCCAGCEPKVDADPLKYITLIDQAWQGKGKFMPAH